MAGICERLGLFGLNIEVKCARVSAYSSSGIPICIV